MGNSTMVDNFELASIFTDHMVLQRDTAVPIWGKAAEGGRICVEFLGQSFEAEAVNGKWSVSLPSYGAGGPYEMKVTDGIGEVVIKDILIGEVWIAGGQSNMEFVLDNSLNGIEEASFADYPDIRYYDVPKIAFENGEETSAKRNTWEVCTPAAAGRFSAVAFYFAKNLHKSLKVPVGMIGCNWGGTSASCWMSEWYLSMDTETKSYLDEFNTYMEKHDPKVYKSECITYDKAVDDYNKAFEKAKSDNVKPEDINKVAGTYPWPPPMGPDSFLRPAGLYYTMLQKIVPYAAMGVIWYQGESDAHKPQLYRRLFSNLIENWRKDFNNQKLYFLFVQLTAYDCDGLPDGEDWALLRESQQYVAENVNYTAMAVSIDCGDQYDIHPRNKGPLGKRLALLAGNKVYGQDVECRGPVFREMIIEGSKAVLFFDNAGTGLNVPGDTPKGFKISSEDGRFVNAQAHVKGNTVEVFSDSVARPAAVRYAWANYSEANLYNNSGLPAAPFRTDRDNE